MLFAQFSANGNHHDRFLILESLESHGYFSEEYTGEAGDFEARDIKGNTGVLSVRPHSGSPSEIEITIAAYTGGGVLQSEDITDFAAWLLREGGASDLECKQIFEATERLIAAK